MDSDIREVLAESALHVRSNSGIQRFASARGEERGDRRLARVLGQEPGNARVARRALELENSLRAKRTRVAFLESACHERPRGFGRRGLPARCLPGRQL